MDELEKQRKSRNRRIALLLVGAGLGVACRFAPQPYQAPCMLVAKAVGLLVGG